MYILYTCVYTCVIYIYIYIHTYPKGHEPNWSSTRYKVVGIKGNQYLIPSINKDKSYLRHELLKSTI